MSASSRWLRCSALSLVIALVLVAGCGRAAAPPVVTTPRYPDYIFPTLSPPDPKQADLLRRARRRLALVSGRRSRIAPSASFRPC